jgi:hypothetical protein
MGGRNGSAFLNLGLAVDLDMPGTERLKAWFTQSSDMITKQGDFMTGAAQAGS